MVQRSVHLTGGTDIALSNDWMLELIAQLFESGIADAATF